MGKLRGRRLQIKLHRFANVAQRLGAGLSLGPTALERRAMGYDVAVRSRFQDYLDCHGYSILP
jgi:hypothetical protein